MNAKHLDANGRLTISARLMLCFETLTATSGHRHPAHEKQLSIFQRGYVAGMQDAQRNLIDELKPVLRPEGK